MIVDYVKWVLGPLVKFLYNLQPGYGEFILLGLALLLGYLYTRVNFRSVFSPQRGDWGFMLVFGFVLFLFFECFLKI